MSTEKKTQHYITYVGAINAASTMRLRAQCCDLVNGDANADLTIMMSSRGGALLDGFALYNFLQALPVKLTMVNIGTIQSIANIVFLAADTRIACEDSYFMLHGFERTYRQEKVAHRDLLEDTAVLEREKSSFIGILKRRTKITNRELDELKPFEKQILVNTSRARKLGMIEKVQQPKIPKGAKIWNVEYKA